MSHEGKYVEWLWKSQLWETSNIKKRIGDLNFYARTKRIVNRNQYPEYEIIKLKNYICHDLSF